MNLWEEVLETLEENNKTVADIKFVQTKKGRIENFKELAKKINYHNGFGDLEIDQSLVIVGNDWWLERDEYKGSEWFEFKQQPKALDFTQHELEDIYRVN